MWNTGRQGTAKNSGRSKRTADILIHQAAKKYFDSKGITKLPSVKALREEYAGLLEQKRKAYAEYKQARSDMKELQNIKANVDYLLDIPARRHRRTAKSRGNRSSFSIFLICVERVGCER